MSCIEVINILAIVFSPIIAVLVGCYLQDREKNRNDKMMIFRSLMMNRGLGWSTESVRALNIIEIVFADDAKVLEQWRKYYQMLCIQIPSDSKELSNSEVLDIEKKLRDIESARVNFLVTMAQSLGYKETITRETIRNAYIPMGLSKSIEQQQQNQKAISKLTTMVFNNQENKENNDGKNAHGNAGHGF